MTFRPLVLVALVILVPVFCVDIRKRCELRDQLRSSLFPKRIWDDKLSRVICEVEKFVNRSTSPTMSPATPPPFNSSTPALNSSTPLAPGPKSGSEEDRVGKYLQQCVAVTNGTDVRVDAACLGKLEVFIRVYLNASEECKKINPKVFFKDCSKSDESNSNSSSNESSESGSDEDSSDSESKERPKPQWKSKSKAKFGKKNRH